MKNQSIQSTIEKFLESDYCAALAPATRELYANALMKNFVPFCDDYSETELNAEFVTNELPAYARHLEDQNKSGSTVAQYINIVKIMMRALGMPVQYIYRRKSQDRKAQKVKSMNRWFDEKEIETCLKVSSVINIKVRDELIIRLLIETGARVQEISNITWADVHLDDNTVFLRTSKTQPRPAFFSEKTKILFNQIKQTSLFEYYDSNPIFPSTSRVKDIVNSILKKLDLKNGQDGRGAHTFRHWTATYLYYLGGMDLTDIATLLGDRPETIRDTYLHPTPEMLKKRVVKAMGWTDV